MVSLFVKHRCRAIKDILSLARRNGIQLSASLNLFRLMPVGYGSQVPNDQNVIKKTIGFALVRTVLISAGNSEQRRIRLNAFDVRETIKNLSEAWVNPFSI